MTSGHGMSVMNGSSNVSHGDPEWQIELPGPVPADGEVDFAFIVEEPRPPLELGCQPRTGASASSSAR
jgi:hypothetical protein